MSENTSSQSSGPVSVWSPFETFEMPTTGIVLELPSVPHTSSCGPVSGDLTVATEPKAIESIDVEPVATEPVSSEPIAVQPVVLERPVTEAVVIESSGAEVAATESVTIPPPAAQSAAVDVAATFLDLPLSDAVHQAILKTGYDKPTDIQAEIIPHMLAGRDVLAQSQTGTGKTAAFALPILSGIDVNRRTPKVLVLAPTRELAIQVGKSFSTYAACLPGFSVAAIYGGQDYELQFRQLRRGVQVVVGTPGRVIDHIKRGTLDLSGIECLVLDEADEMLNMGFLDDVQFVLDQTPEGRQVALFSATLPGPIRKIAQQYLNDPVRITIKKKTMTVESVRQRALFVAPRDKIDVLTRFLAVEETDGVIVFTKTREATVLVAEQLAQQGLSAIALNGDMPQKVRERTIEQLKAGHLNILVATDVAARGLDVPRVSHVFNFDVPNDSESYVHRIGRTGRAGRSGEAIIFLTNSQRYKLRSIENATKQPIEVVQPPTTDEINTIRISRFRQKITDTVQNQDLSMFDQLISQHAAESGQPIASIAAALAYIGQAGQPFLLQERPQRKKYDGEKQGDHRAGRERFGRRDRDDRSERNSGGERFADRSAGPNGRRRDEPRQLGPPREGMDRYRIEVGSKDGVMPGNIVGAVANEGGIAGDQIGPISIHHSHSTVDLPSGMPSDIYQTLQQTWVAGKQLKLSRDFAEKRRDTDASRGSFPKRKFSQASKHKKRKTKSHSPG